MFVQIIRFSYNHRCSHHTYIKKKHRQLGYKAKLDNNYDLWSKPNFSLRSDHMLSKFTPLSSDNNFFSRSENTFTNLVSDHIFSLKSSIFSEWPIAFLIAWTDKKRHKGWLYDEIK